MDGHVFLASFHHADVRAMRSGTLGQIFPVHTTLIDQIGWHAVTHAYVLAASI
jgi:hypothetical protein